MQCKVLGVHWETGRDELVVDISNVVSQADMLSPTKRSVVGTVSQFYDPLGILSPVIITFKMFLQELTESEVDWDQLLTDALLRHLYLVYLQSLFLGLTCIIQNLLTNVICVGSVMPLLQLMLQLFIWSLSWERAVKLNLLLQRHGWHPPKLRWCLD